MPRKREFWCQVLLRMKPEMSEELDAAVKRTGLTTQEILREAIRRGLPLIENKPAI